MSEPKAKYVKAIVTFEQAAALCKWLLEQYKLDHPEEASEMALRPEQSKFKCSALECYLNKEGSCTHQGTVRFARIRANLFYCREYERKEERKLG